MYLRVVVIPDAHKECVTPIKNGALRISVSEPSSRNMANTRVRQLVAEHLNVSISTVRIMTGHHKRSKMIYIRD